MRSRILIPLVLILAVLGGVVFYQWSDPPETLPVPEWTEEGRWYKGNTHTHSLWSDGNDFPEMVVDWYETRGYDFLALSDHNILSRGEKWMSLKQVESRRKVGGSGTFERYVERFGNDWVEERGEVGSREVRLKNLEEIRPLFEESGDFLLIEAEEITDRYKQYPIHINAINLGEKIEPQHGDSVVETMRNNLRMVEEQAKRLGRPILTHVNHPNFHWAITPKELAEVVEEQFFEVYNGHPGINHQGDMDRPGDEAIWDMANTLRILVHDAPPLFGVATDDSHHYHGGDSSSGRGWVMVWADKLEAGALIKAMERGEFYASSGVELETIDYESGERRCSLKIKEAEGVEFETRFVGTKRGTPNLAGEVFKTVTGKVADYELSGDELYVRAVVTSSRLHSNGSFKGQREQAWTQPVGWRK